MTREPVKITFEEYEALRAEYRAVFGQGAPHCQPLEMDFMAADIRDAIERGEPLELYPEGYVT